MKIIILCVLVGAFALTGLWGCKPAQDRDPGNDKPGVLREYVSTPLEKANTAEKSIEKRDQAVAEQAEALNEAY